jgi:hypothetical protein
MIIKKSNGRVYGANLTAAEKKAMDLEIQRQFADYLSKSENEISAIILWELHEQFRFGQKRLKDFYIHFGKSVKELIARYELENSDDIWLCTRKLKEIGVDLDEWRKHTEV